MSVFNDVIGISITSEYFNGSNEYKLFENKNDRVAMIFGRNGSGKSTIAQGFIEYANSINPRNIDLKLITKDGTTYISPNGKVSKIFVFNEEYINNNVKLKEDGLDTIVLLGAQVGLEEKIAQKETDIEAIVKQLEDIDNNIKVFNNTKHSNSPDFWFSTISKKLRESWAEIQGIKINGKLKKATVNEATIHRIGKLKPSLKKDELQIEFNSKLKILNSTDSNSLPITQSISKISYNKNIFDDSKEALHRTVRKPVLTDRESELLNIFGIDELTTAKDYISNNVGKICPKCLREITTEHKNEIVSKITNIISRESENFKKELEKLLLVEIPISDYDVFKVLEEHLYSDLITIINKLNELTVKHNICIGEKISNPFESAEYTIKNIVPVYEELNKVIEQIEKRRLDYNNAISDRNRLKEALSNLNDQIAYYNIKDDYKQYNKSVNDKSAEIRRQTETKNKLSALRTDLQHLNAERQNLQLAADSLNRELQYIFYSSKRLLLTVDEKEKRYKLKVNGKSVKPNKISSGERNALALCYFFADIAKNMNADNPYSDEMFLVIDDPLSSFDYENKIGIMSFLKFKMKSILSGSDSTKAIIMTHDISFFMDFSKALEEISKYCNSIGKKATYQLLYLHNKSINEFMYKKQNEYTDLLTEIFEYANSDSVDENNSIGNQMRRVLEAFSTFSFKIGIEELSTKQDILDLLPTPELKDYFENLMYRIVLNGESHGLDTARFFPRTDFYENLSPEEKQRTAKDILVFMYLLNPKHIESHLNESINIIEQWKNEISSPN